MRRGKAVSGLYFVHVTFRPEYLDRQNGWVYSGGMPGWLAGASTIHSINPEIHLEIGWKCRSHLYSTINKSG